MRITRDAVEITTPGEQVPGILVRPVTASRVPAALLLHGLSSSKERMADSIGRALAERGIASLSIDLPLHGAREGDLSSLTLLRPLAIVSKWKVALTDLTAALDFLSEASGIDGSRLVLVGYSLGAFLAAHAAANDSRIEGVVLAAGGDLPEGLPFETMVRAVADPTRAVRRLNMPVLMINGRYDRTVTPAQARRLHEAAREPKTIRWYNGGHWPPQPELEAAAEWASELLGSPMRRAG